MYDSFCQRRDEIAKQSEEKFDALNPKNHGFVEVYSHFNQLVLDYDRRLSTIASLAFSNAGNLESACKIILAFQGLLDRPAIAEEFNPNYIKLITNFDNELSTVKRIFDEQKSSTILAKNMPTTAGLLLVCFTFRNFCCASPKKVSHFLM